MQQKRRRQATQAEQQAAGTTLAPFGGISEVAQQVDRPSLYPCTGVFASVLLCFCARHSFDFKSSPTYHLFAQLVRDATNAVHPSGGSDKQPDWSREEEEEISHVLGATSDGREPVNDGVWLNSDHAR